MGLFGGTCPPRRPSSTQRPSQWLSAFVALHLSVFMQPRGACFYHLLLFFSPDCDVQSTFEDITIANGTQLNCAQKKFVTESVCVYYAWASSGLGIRDLLLFGFTLTARMNAFIFTVIRAFLWRETRSARCLFHLCSLTLPHITCQAFVAVDYIDPLFNLFQTIDLSW